MWSFKKFHRASRCDKPRKGATAVEMALIAPVFFMMLMGVTETSLIMLVQHLLESATFNASRLAKTGFVTEGRTQLETVMDSLNTQLGHLSPLVDVSKLSMISTSYGNLSQIDQPEQGTEGLGTAQEVVVYTISYPWKFFTPMIGDIIGDENVRVQLTSRIVVRNEPY